MATVAVCGVCNSAPSKYKCPKCEVKYCGIPCFKLHKEICGSFSKESQAPTIGTSSETQSDTKKDEIDQGKAPMGEGASAIKNLVPDIWDTKTQIKQGAFDGLKIDDDKMLSNEQLKKLGDSKELQAMLQQNKLRELLIGLHNGMEGVNNIQDAEAKIQAALQDRDFAAMADSCLAALGMK
eukprot:Ihof_evm6s64 gene=Ihof_evmTU6s64